MHKYAKIITNFQVTTHFLGCFENCFESIVLHEKFLVTIGKKSVLGLKKTMFDPWGFLFNISFGSKSFSLHVKISFFY